LRKLLRTCTLQVVIRRAIGEEIRVDFNTGSGGGSGAGGSSGGAGVPPPPRVSGGVSGGADFDYRDLVPSFIQTVREVLFNPVNFFRGIRKQGDYLNPLVFAIICSLITAIIGGFLGLIISLIAGQGVGSSIAGLVGNIIGIPIATTIGLFIGAGIYHLLVLLFVRPAHAGYEATFRAVAYAQAVQAVAFLAFIPILGILVILVIAVYQVVLNVIAIREMHATTTGRAVLVVLVPVAIVLILGLLLVGTILAIFAAAVSQAQ
jgi:hypothetical protein